MLRFAPPRKHILIILLALLFFLIPNIRHALADYLGPDRVIRTYHTETYDVGVWAETGNSCFNAQGNPSDCIICSWKRNPGNACGSADYWYKTGTESKVVETVTVLPEATITGTLQNCNLHNG